MEGRGGGGGEKMNKIMMKRGERWKEAKAPSRKEQASKQASKKEKTKGVKILKGKGAGTRGRE